MFFRKKADSPKEYFHAGYKDKIFSPFLWSRSSTEGGTRVSLPGGLKNHVSEDMSENTT